MTENDREPQANIPPFGLRMQPILKEAVSTAAKANNRSMNAEIVARLEQSFNWPVLSTALRVVLEDSADLNNQSVAEEITARLEFTRMWDSDYFNPASENVRSLDPGWRMQGIEDRLDELTRLIRHLAGERSDISIEPDGTDDEPPFE